MSYNYEDMSWSDVRDLFRTWREGNQRNSEEVVQLWEAVLEDQQDKLGNEKYLILEQVVISALDYGRLELAEATLRVLAKAFPKSLRVLKFRAMQYEASERYDEALELLDKIIKRDETNAAPRKRRIAIFKARGRIGEAIKELTEYLKRCMSDQEAWQTLGDLYLEEGDLARAAFCFEELILHNPHSHLMHQRLADIKYTQGGTDNMEIAKAYYGQSLKLHSGNIRSLYGLFLACTNLANSQKVTAAKKKEHTKMAQWALGQVTAIHEKQKVNTSTKLPKELVTALLALHI